MIFFIVFLRFLAACLITNSHYTGGIYPTEIIANGGLLGDVIFFAVSGYCLYNIKHCFPYWYGKRLLRCYLPVLIITGIYLLCGFYTLEERNLFWWLVYPTNYHFVASIVLLYIPYYFIMKIKVLRDRLPVVFGIIVLAHILVYIFAYDKTYYHIDTVREPMIWFLFMESMLLGAWFRQNDIKFRNKFHWYYIPVTVVFIVLYFGSKLAVSKYTRLSGVQILNQFVLLLLLVSIFLIVSSIDGKLENIPKWLKKPISFISELTLEIYVVQYVLIDLLRDIGTFPISWFAITFSILISATVLHFICKGVLWLANLFISKIFKKNESIKV